MIGLLGHLISVPTVAPTLATMIGLGVGIDYALFLVTKHRKLASGVQMRIDRPRGLLVGQRHRLRRQYGHDRARLTRGRGHPLVTTLGVASAIAVLAAVLTSITLLPAILSLVGGGIHRLRLPRFLQLKKRPEGRTRWDAWARGVARHPWLAIVLAAVILAPLIALSSLIGPGGHRRDPRSTTERQAYDLLTRGFGVGYNGPLLIALELVRRRTQRRLPAEVRRGHRSSSEAGEGQKRLKREQSELEREQSELEAQRARRSARRSSDGRPGSRRARPSWRPSDRGSRNRRRGCAPEPASRDGGASDPGHLTFILGRERFVRHLIEQTTDPDKLERLRRRLARLEKKEARTRPAWSRSSNRAAHCSPRLSGCGPRHGVDAAGRRAARTGG